jgi:hypothetical protein
MTSEESLRSLIREKLASGLLPGHDCTKVLGGVSNGETCDACGEIVAKTELVMDCTSEHYSKGDLSFRSGRGLGIRPGIGGPQIRRRLPHGLLESLQRGLNLTPQHIGCVAQLIALLHQSFRGSTHCLCPAPYGF